MYAVTVTFRVAAGKMDLFLPLMLANAQTSLAEEPDCHVFDVCVSSERPDEVFLYELYSSGEAFQTHLDSAHFKAFDAEVALLVAEKSVATYEEVQR